MATVTDIVFAEQFGHLREVAENKRWALSRTDGPGFILALPARDESRFTLQVICSEFPTLPPIWNWYNPVTNACNEASDTPKGKGGYFHGSGKICAPWNRIAYKQVDAAGPHDDWELSTWMSNPNTNGCTTLTSMAVRMAVELSSPRFQGRRG